MEVPWTVEDILKTYEVSQRYDMVPLLILFFGTFILGNHRKWKHALSKRNKGTCQNSSGLNVMCSPLCGDSWQLQHTRFPHHLHHLSHLLQHSMSLIFL